FILAIFGALGFSWWQYNLTPCDRGLEYSIGRLDNNFGLSEEQFKKYVQNSEAPWEKALGKNVFEYNPAAEFKVNLIYDERQRETILKQKTESGLTAAENFFKDLDAKFNIAKTNYENKVASFESAKSALDARAAKYEQGVDYWNAHKGAPREKYEELEAERVALNREIELLNARAQELKELSNNFNQALRERNEAAKDYNRVVEQYNQKYGGHSEFDQAEYNGEEINIYQFTDSKGLIMALAHEFGHALAMDHVENSKSIMYYLRDSQNLPASPIPTAEDLAELKKVCKL
ncbi:MAG: matrixin family metalloprotease, partial [Patescibacteria group bacterium]